MLYYIDGRIYILAGGYYREVAVSEISKGIYDVQLKANGDKIEYTHNNDMPQIDLKEAYEKTHKKTLKEDL